MDLRTTTGPHVALPAGTDAGTISVPEDRLPLRGRVTPWLWMSVAAALLAAAGNVVGLADVGGFYGRETPAFVDQAVAQDAVDLAVVGPAMIVLAVLARRGRLGAYLAWLGTL